MKRNRIYNLLTAAMVAPVFAAGTAWADEEGDGLPHIAVAQEESGELVLEYEIELGLDLTDPSNPIINLVAPNFDGFLGGYSTEPLNPSLPNADLGFVSEVEGAGENTVINGDIVVRMLDKDDNFLVFFAGGEIFTDAMPDYELGNVFDRHPTWVIGALEGDLDATAEASFEVFDVSTGDIGSGATSLGNFDVALSVPEPTSGLLLLGTAGLLAACRRR